MGALINQLLKNYYHFEDYERKEINIFTAENFI
jgi:hypothetical protein